MTTHVETIHLSLLQFITAQPAKTTFPMTTQQGMGEDTGDPCLSVTVNQGPKQITSPKKRNHFFFTKEKKEKMSGWIRWSPKSLSALMFFNLG